MTAPPTTATPTTATPTTATPTTATTAGRDHPASGVRNPWVVLTVLCMGHLVALLDTTVVNVAIPSMIDGLGAGLQQILWITNGYLLTYAVLLVTGGRLGDLYGPKRLYLTGLAVFTAASAACGLAATPSQAIAARVVQGVGAALLTPQSLAIVSRIFPPDRRGTALGVWGSAAGIAAAAGPTVGGLIIGALGWRWVFYVNIPVGVCAFLLGLVLLPNLRTGKQHRLDLLGTALATAGLFGIVLGLIEGPSRGWGAVWGPVTAPMLIGAGVAVLLAFLLVERGRQAREPLVPFAVFRAPNFSLMAAVVGALPCSLGAMLFLTLIYLQAARGMSALQAGLLVSVAPLLSIVAAPYSGRLVDRVGGKYVLIAGFALFGAGIGGLALVAGVDVAWWKLLPGVAVFGVGMGVVFAPAATIAMHDIPESMSGAASGVFNMSRLSGSLLGGAAVGALLQAQLPASFAATLADHLNGAAADPTDLAFREAITGAVRTTYWLPVAILAAAILATLGVRERRASVFAGSPAAVPLAAAVRRHRGRGRPWSVVDVQRRYDVSRR